MRKLGNRVSLAAVRAGLVLVLVIPLNRTRSSQGPPLTEDQKQARAALNKGVREFKDGQIQAAVDDFQRARQRDPRLLNARLYLATAYAAQYIPGAPSEANRELGAESVEEFREILDLEPQNVSAIEGIGSILFHMAGQPYDRSKFAESKSFHQKHIELRPDDVEPYYWVGVIDWTLSFRGNQELRARFNDSHTRPVRDTEALPVDARREYVQEYGAIIDEGIESLRRAIALRPDYDDAMAYLNLLYRRKADTVDYQNERDELLHMADDLVDKVKEIKTKRAEQPSPP